jgi:hypothetical protein
MSHKLVWRLAALCSLGVLLLSGPGSAQDDFFLWIIVGGGNKGTKSAAGTLLLTRGNDIQVVLPADNKGSQAAGHIPIGPFDDCPHLYHYHGKLYGKEDNGEGCGWGDVVPLEWAPVEVNGLCYAIRHEDEALVDLESNPPKYGEAADDIFAAKVNLDLAVERLAADGNVPGNVRKKVTNLLNTAHNKDDLAGGLVQRQLDGNGQPKDQAHAIKLLNGAVEVKRQAFRKLAKALDLLDDPD